MKQETPKDENCFIDIGEICKIEDKQTSDNGNDKSEDDGTTEFQISTMTYIFKIGGIVLAIVDNITDYLFYDYIVSSNALKGMKDKKLIEDFLIVTAVFFEVMYYFV
jgi:hypothetical protein